MGGEQFLKIGRLVKTGRFPLSRWVGGFWVGGRAFSFSLVVGGGEQSPEMWALRLCSGQVVFCAGVAQFLSLGSMVVEFRVQGLR